MVDSKKAPAQGNSSRTIGIVAVVVLIVVAIAGIVLAGRKSGDSAADPAATATAPASAAASTAVAAAASTGAANEVIFAPGSDKLPAGGSEKIAKFVEAAKGGANKIRISARFLTGANKAKDLELAKGRTGAVHHAMTADGITGDKLQVELVEMPAGAITEADSHRIVLTLQP